MNDAQSLQVVVYALRDHIRGRDPAPYFTRVLKSEDDAASLLWTVFAFCCNAYVAMCEAYDMDPLVELDGVVGDDSIETYKRALARAMRARIKGEDPTPALAGGMQTGQDAESLMWMAFNFGSDAHVKACQAHGLDPITQLDGLLAEIRKEIRK